MEVLLSALFGNVAKSAVCVLWGYIDPSTGSLIFQVAAASLISAGLFFKGLRDRIAWLMTGGWRSKQPMENEIADADTSDAESAIAGKIAPDECARKAA